MWFSRKWTAVLSNSLSSFVSEGLVLPTFSIGEGVRSHPAHSAVGVTQAEAIGAGIAWIAEDIGEKPSLGFDPHVLALVRT